MTKSAYRFYKLRVEHSKTLGLANYTLTNCNQTQLNVLFSSRKCSKFFIFTTSLNRQNEHWSNYFNSYFPLKQNTFL